MKAIIASIMLIFFLTGQINLTLAAHYCGDELKSTELSVAPEQGDCCSSDLDKKADPACCTDEYSSSDSDDYFGKTTFQIQLAPEFVLAYVLTIPGIQALDIQVFNPEYLFPGLPILDLNILYQSFLI